MAEVVVPEWFNASTYFVDRNLDEGRGDNVAILYGAEEVTYRKVAERMNQTGNAFLDLGVEMENRIMLLMLDCPELAYCFFGAIKIGAVPVPVNTLLKAQDYRYLLEDSRAKVLVVSAELLPIVESELRECAYLKHVIVAGQANEPSADESGPYRSFEDVVGGQAMTLQAARTHRDDVAFWLYTSGTTGMSRAAVHLQHDMVFCSELYCNAVLDMREDDRTFSLAKLFFAYGLGNALYGPFAVGATTILFPGRPQPNAVFEVVNRYKPTLFFAVPTAYAAMLQAAEHGAHSAGRSPAVDMSTVRACVSAGESLPASLFTRWKERFGVEIYDGIGSTEVLHIFLTNRRGDVRPGSTGKAVPGYDLKLVDDDGNPVPAGQIGNLSVRGDSTCAYYWNKHEQTKRAIQGEWISTGDKYHVDADGYYWYAGRTDDMLKVGGIWVSPAEVESVIVEHPAVLECAVVGAADAEMLIKPKAFVVLKVDAADGDRLELRPAGLKLRPAGLKLRSAGLELEIQEFVKGRIAPYKYPRWIEFVDELPKTATGKIQRFKLRQM